MTNNLDAAPLWLQLLLVGLAATRTNVFLVDDTILAAPRDWLRSKLNETFDYLTRCLWCVGFWVALVWGIAWMLWPIGTTVVAVPWAIAYLCGHLPPDPVEDDTPKPVRPSFPDGARPTDNA